MCFEILKVLPTVANFFEVTSTVKYDNIQINQVIQQIRLEVFIAEAVLEISEPSQKKVKI